MTLFAPHPLARAASAALLGALALAAAAASAQTASAPFGLVCHLTERSHSDCSVMPCVKTQVAPYDETRWYVVDPVKLKITQYGPTGVPTESPFRGVSIAINGDLRADGGELGMGEGSVASFFVNVNTHKGGLDVLIIPGGEFAKPGNGYNVDGACEERPLALVMSDKTVR